MIIFIVEPCDFIYSMEAVLTKKKKTFPDLHKIMCTIVLVSKLP